MCHPCSRKCLREPHRQPAAYDPSNTSTESQKLSCWQRAFCLQHFSRTRRATPRARLRVHPVNLDYSTIDDDDAVDGDLRVGPQISYLRICHSNGPVSNLSPQNSCCLCLRCCYPLRYLFVSGLHLEHCYRMNRPFGHHYHVHLLIHCCYSWSCSSQLLSYKSLLSSWTGPLRPTRQATCWSRNP